MELGAYQQHINQLLTTHLTTVTGIPPRLAEAMNYAVLNGGKRVRPLLVYATGELFALPLSLLDPAALAVEFIHSYSLIHDDLPAMDNDDLRRGKPTCHKAFDEATAILAGDALQTLAFQTLAMLDLQHITASQLQALITTLSAASGASGMAGGQMLDLEATGTKLTLEALENIHRLKTGALINASIHLSVILGNASPTEQHALSQFAHHLGLAFQIQDDILDVESSTQQLGKRQGADQALNKPTYVSLLGLSAAKTYLQHTYQQADTALATFGTRAQRLKELTEYIRIRQH